MTDATKTGGTILVIDDDDMDCMIMKKILDNSQFTTIIAKNGTEAMILTKEHKLDCIVLDYLLPDYDGFYLLDFFQNWNVNVPVITVTGGGDELLAVKMLKRGAFDYVPKKEMDTLLLPAVLKAVNTGQELKSELEDINQDIKKRIADWDQESD